MVKRKLAMLAALPCLAFAPLQNAKAQDFSQLSEEDVSVLVRFVLPTAFAQMQTKCAGELPADSYIYENSDELAARFEAASQGTTLRATELFMALGGSDDPAMTSVISQMPPDVLGPFVREIVAGMLAQEITPASCAPANRIMELLDPMPAQNTADLIGYIVVFMTEQRAKEATENNGG